MDQNGKTGCGCLIFLLVAFMVIVGILIHPFTLRIVASQLRYEDKPFASDAIFVPRFFADTQGELYEEAFREYWAGNARTIYVEEDRVMGMSLYELVQKMAKERKVPKDAVKRLAVQGDTKAKIAAIKANFEASGIKRVIILVPEYASRRYHIIFNSSAEKANVIYLIRPVTVSYFKKDRWWKDSATRELIYSELISISSYYIERLRSR